MEVNAVPSDIPLVKNKNQDIFLKTLEKKTSYIAILACFLFLAIFSLFKLLNYEKHIETTYEIFENTPIVISAPIETINNKLIFISHGFAGSTSFMRPIAISLAKAGFITIRFDFLGHGRHPQPYTGDITTVEGATQNFVKQTNSILTHYFRKYQKEAGVIIGHSMASDIVIRSAKRNSKIEGVIGISTYSNAITPTEPKNLLILNGQWEPPLRNKAKDMLSVAGIKNPQESILYGNFQDGTARKAIAVKNSDHIGVLYSTKTQQEIIKWVKQLSSKNLEFIPNRIGLWAALLFSSLFISFILSLKFLPDRKLRKYQFKFGRFFFGNVMAAILIPYVLKIYTIKFLTLPAHNYLINHLLLTSVLLIILLPIKFDKSLLKSFNLYIFALLFIFFTFVLGGILDNYVSSFYISDSRIRSFVFLTLGCVPIMVIVQMFYQASKHGWIMGNIGKLSIILSLSISILLDFKQLFILGYAVILLIAFGLIFGFLANLINNKYNNFLSVGIANGLVLAWAFATALPTYIP